MNPAIDWTKAPWPASHAINRKGAQGTVWYVQTILGHVWASVWGEEWVRIEDKLPEGCEPRPAESDHSEAPKSATHIRHLDFQHLSVGQEWLRSQRPEEQFSESMRDAIALAEELKGRKSRKNGGHHIREKCKFQYAITLNDVARQAHKTDENILKEERTAREFPCEGYEKLHSVFRQAHDHAAYDKGAERHANDLPFHEQRMQTISEGLDSPLGMAYQVEKKIKEGLQMADYGACRRELLGALNYLAGIVIFMDKKNS